MKMVRALFVFAVFLAPCAWAAPAQPPAVDDEKSGPVFSTEVIASSDAELKGTNASEYRHVSFYHASWALAQTIPVRPTSTLTFGLNYSVSGRRVTEPPKWADDKWADFKATHPDWDRVPIPTRLQALSANVEYATEVNGRWTLSTNVGAGSYVATKGLLSKGCGFSTSVMGLYKWSPTLDIAVGVAFDSLSHDYRLVPLIGFDWQLNDKWSLAIGFPSTALTYSLTKRLTLGIEASGSGGTFYVQDDPAPGIAPRSLAESKLETIEVRLGFKAAWKINDTFSISGTSGHVLYREFKYIDRGYKLKSHNLASFIALGGTISF
ncbi:MAG: DUF6268 family outer membrane beta-barrel protein [Nibricoccus sp.]